MTAIMTAIIEIERPEHGPMTVEVAAEGYAPGQVGHRNSMGGQEEPDFPGEWLINLQAVLVEDVFEYDEETGDPIKVAIHKGGAITLSASEVEQAQDALDEAAKKAAED